MLPETFCRPQKAIALQTQCTEKGLIRVSKRSKLGAAHLLIITTEQIAASRNWTHTEANNLTHITSAHDCQNL